MQQYQPLYTQVGVPLSMYAGKTRSYLLRKTPLLSPDTRTAARPRPAQRIPRK
jgi:hypothetical protein